jgi:competence protein ComFC
MPLREADSLAIVKTSPMRILGRWNEAFALDYHSIRSVPTGDLFRRFDTLRTDLGERLFRLKYRKDPAMLDDIIDTMDDFFGRWKPAVDCICTSPPSVGRAEQPVDVIAERFSKRVGLPIIGGATQKIKVTPQMKNVALTDRKPLLTVAVIAGPESVEGKSVLLLDDLYDSGATSSRVCEILLDDKKAKSVFGLAITRTRR